MNRISKKLNRKAEVNENTFDSLRDKFYEGTKKYFDKEEQDKIWNGEYNGEKAAKTLNEKEMDRFLDLLNKYGLIEDYHDKIFITNSNSYTSYLGLLLNDEDNGNNEDNEFEIIKKWENYMYKGKEYVDLIFYYKNCCRRSDSYVKFVLDNFSNKIINELGSIIYSYLKDDEIKAALKPYYSDNKIICILNGFVNRLSIEEIKEKIKKELPENEW